MRSGIRHVCVAVLAPIFVTILAPGTVGGQEPLFSDITAQALGAAPFVHAGASVDLFPFSPLPGEPAPLAWLGGVAVADVNGDGWNDIFVTNGRGGANALYLNHADAPATFTEVAAVAGVDFPGDEAAAVTVGDIDNDGRIDLYVTNVGLAFGPPFVQANGPNRLFRNLGNDAEGVPRFAEVGAATAAAGNPFTRSQLPNLVDFDRDGDLDIYVGAHHPIVNPSFVSESPDYPVKRPSDQSAMLLRNLLVETGELGFTDATDLLRLEHSGTFGADGRPIIQSRFNFDGAWADIDNDGWPDLLQANDLGALGVFHNDGGEFTFMSPEAGLDEVGAWMAMVPGDINADGFLDFFASNVGLGSIRSTFDNQRHGLFLNDRQGGFRDVAAQTGVAEPTHDGDASGDFGWGGQLFDIDNDGDLDLFFIGNWWPNGLGIRDGVDENGQPFGLATGGHTNRGHLFENRGTVDQVPVLVDLMESAAGREAVGIDNPFDARGVAVGDLDADGFLDLVISNVSGRATGGGATGFTTLGNYQGRLAVYRNRGNSHRVLKLRLRGTVSNRAGIGARVRVVAQGAPRVRELRAGEGHLSSNSLEVTVGLGDARAIGLIRIDWPSGIRQELAGFPLDEQVTVLEVVESP